MQVYCQNLESIQNQANKDFQVVHTHLISMEASNTTLWNTVQLQMMFLQSKIKQLENEVARLTADKTP
jgi:hypothetical protein